MKLFWASFIFILLSILLQSHAKTVGVIGRLECTCEKAANCMKATVTLMEDDGGPDWDDEMVKVSATIGNTFRMEGSQFEFFAIEPYLLIDHSCPDGVPKTKRIDLKPVRDEELYRMKIDLQEQ